MDADNLCLPKKVRCAFAFSFALSCESRITWSSSSSLFALSPRSSSPLISIDGDDNDNDDDDGFDCWCWCWCCSSIATTMLIHELINFFFKKWVKWPMLNIYVWTGVVKVWSNYSIRFKKRRGKRWVSGPSLPDMIKKLQGVDQSIKIIGGKGRKLVAVAQVQLEKRGISMRKQK